MKKILLILFIASVFYGPLKIKPVFAQVVNNGNFEGGFSCADPTHCDPNGWFRYGNTWWQQEIYNFTSPSNSVKYGVLSGDGGHSQTIDVTQGATYTISGWSYRFYSKSGDIVGIQFGSGAIDWRPLYGVHGTGSWYNFSLPGYMATAPTLTIYLRAIDNPFEGASTANDVYFDDITVIKTANPPTPTSAPQNLPQGYSVYTSNSCAAISGWSCDANYPSGPIQIDLWDQTNSNPALWTFLGSTNTNSFWDNPSSIRCSLAAPQNYGYSFPIPSSIKDNTAHKVGVYGINVTSSGAITGSGNILLQGIQDGVQTADKLLTVQCISLPTPTLTFTPTPTNTPTPTPTPRPPAITSLKINNSSTPSYAGIYKTSGNQTTQTGSNWLNPMKITLNATQGSGTITNYYVAFYNKTAVGSPYSSIIVDTSNSSIPIASIRNLPSSDYFVLKYTNAGRYYVWNQSTNSWVDITGLSKGQKICGPGGCGAQTYYKVYPGDTLGNPSNPNMSNTWTITFDQNFGSKTMYSAGYITDSNNRSAYQSDITPTQ